MPKFIGNTIPGSRDLDDAPAGDVVRLSYSQAVLLPASDVYHVLDTSDRGSRRSLAKRWYRWYSAVEAIESCDRSTRKMLEAAREVRTSSFTILGANLARVAASHYERSGAKAIDTLATSIASAAVAAAGVHVLAARPELLHELVLGSGSYDERRAVATVATDALIDAGVSSTSAGSVLWHLWSINSDGSNGTGRRVRAALAGVVPDLVARAREIWGAA